MRPDPSPYQAVYQLIDKSLDPKEFIPLVLDAIDSLILSRTTKEGQLLHSTQSCLQYLLTKAIITEDLFHKINLIKSYISGVAPMSLLNSSLAVWTQLIEIESNHSIPQDLISFQFSLSDKIENHFTATDSITINSARISVLKWDEKNDRLHFILNDGGNEMGTMLLSGLAEKNRKLILQSLRFLSFPFDMYVHQLSKDKNHWKADEFVIMPDFLVDVTSIASCFSSRGSNPLKHLIHLYHYSITGLSTLIGTSVNQFLDELILNPQLNFDETSQNIFQHNPVAFTLLSDSDVIKYYDAIKSHFKNIKEIVSDKFNQLIEDPENCLMEPSFYSTEFGIQGRLDVFHENKKNHRKLIIELKSGKPFLPNKYGINSEHHAQIMLYYMLIQSVFGTYQQMDSCVLYSSLTEHALKNAPVIEEIKQELIHLRNSIILLHLHLSFRKPADPFILDLISEKNYSLAESYTKRDAALILNIYSTLSSIEQDYFKELSGFIAREQFISKLGRSSTQYTEGLASLWLLNEEEKIANFMILHGLIIKALIIEKGEYPVLVLIQSADHEYLSNFRTGDTLILYSGSSALKEQIYKCTLIELFPNEYHVRLRTRQFPDSESAKKKKWNLEHDSLDRSFIHQFQGLLEFAQAEPEARQKIMGLKEPGINQNLQSEVMNDIPVAIHHVLNKIKKSQDYFLLWGPPGSGKTSIIIKHLTKLLMSDSKENILLLAYTNRAVDEICEAIESNESEYIRIGSRFSVLPKFRKNLLEEKIKTFKSRKQLLELFNKTRIFTATISSIQGKKELFYLKKFDTVIIDEASQILESQLCGLLPRFKKFILVGDHMQLPAVTAQSAEESSVYSDDLKQNGFQSLGTSLFERLLFQCKSKQWNHAFEMLTVQGRMHEELMKFPSALFYDNRLEVIEEEKSMRQTKSYSSAFSKQNNSIHQYLISNRKLFIPCVNHNFLNSSKTNVAEARLVSNIISDLFELYAINKKPWNEFTVGVITPFRAQIAQIKKQLHLKGLDSIAVSVDTSERYQGSTRDIIIISTVISEESQIAQISSLNQNGVDRKLNVALTRAKEQIIIIGNKQALSVSALYRSLLQSYQDGTELLSHYEQQNKLIAEY